MPTIFEHKELTATETPILLFDCTLGNGETERWSTHAVMVDGQTYSPRVLQHNLFELQTASDLGVDAIPKASITLANADSHFSEIERSVGWKGAGVTVRFLFFKLKDNEAETESMILFKGIANPPDEITESTFRLTAVNRMSLQRVLLPPIRVERHCPWDFPATSGQREEAATGGAEGSYSRYYRCGYSPDVEGGAGNLNGDVPFTSCNFTRADCEARGMFGARRFGGIEFVPASILVRSYGEKGTHLSPLTDNEARYNDFVPLVYGAAWHSPLIVFARNDGNLTRMEVLLCMGEIEGVVKVLVNDFEIPLGQNGVNMTGTGWFNVVSVGNRTGDFNTDFTDSTGTPAGDPYGSMAYLSVVVPNRINDGQSLPTIKVLLHGAKLPVYASDGSLTAVQYSNNPAWVLMDILRRSGWSIGELDVASFALAAGYCDEQIDTTDLYGNDTTVARFQCNLVLTARRTAADVVRGIRNGSRLYLTYTAGGLLQLRVENTLALQQPTNAASSNSTSVLDGGWPRYEFGDGSGGTTGILRRGNGEPTLRLWSRNTTDTPNRFTVEFQDAFNEYQQDSLSLADVEDVTKTGQEITGPFPVLGIPQYDQAARILKFNLDRSIQGNTYVDFETSVRAVGLQPGDLISLTYLKEGFTRQPFRVLRIAPGTNYQTAAITAQIHKDSWYIDTNGQTQADGRRQFDPSLGVPKPLIGTVVDDNGDIQFGIVETSSGEADGGSTIHANVSFFSPAPPTLTPIGIPLLSFAPTIGTSGGTLGGSQTLYYALSAVNAAGEESALSFVVRATIPAGGATHTVTIGSLSFSSATVAFHVYRGPSPWQLFRIASDQTVAASFVDTGLTEELATPPDANYHHANFYWRRELQPEYAATIHSSNTVGNSTLEMTVDDNRGAIVRITRGRGAGEERPVLSNTATTLTLTRPWAIEPDASSYFVVADSGWRFGATGMASPVQFEIPNHTGETVEIMGLAANANDTESPSELATVTRWVIGGAGGGGPDEEVPPLPNFGFSLPYSEGYIELTALGFPSLDNTQTISSATFTIYYFDETAGQPAAKLDGTIDTTEQTLHLTVAGPSAPGSLIQIEYELMRVDAVLDSGSTYQVTRGYHGTTAATHTNQTIYPLQTKLAIASFARDFFGSPASGGWGLPVLLPDARVASAELFVSNSRGASPTAFAAVTSTVDGGLRTLSGGQYSIEVAGFLAVENGAAPDLVIDATHAVRDIYAVVRQAPTGGYVTIRLNQGGTEYCTLTIAAGATLSSIQDGLLMPPLTSGARVTMDITSVGVTNPGSDLTLLIRL